MTTSGLFNSPREGSKEPSEAYLEQYRLYVDQLDKLTDRRQSANSFFFSLNTGICAAFAFLCSKDTDAEIKPLLFALPVAGILLAYFWQKLVVAHKQLSTGKFAILHEIESRLPMSLFRAEWLALGEGKDRAKYTPLTHIEVWVPRVFLMMYVALLAYLVRWTTVASAIGSLAAKVGMHPVVGGLAILVLATALTIVRLRHSRHQLKPPIERSSAKPDQKSKESIDVQS